MLNLCLNISHYKHFVIESFLIDLKKNFDHKTIELNYSRRKLSGLITKDKLTHQSEYNLSLNIKSNPKILYLIYKLLPM